MPLASPPNAGRDIAKRITWEQRTAVGVALIVVAIGGAALLAVGMELGLGVLAAFCVVSLVWMAFNSWALLFAIADAEIAQEEPGTR